MQLTLAAGPACRLLAHLAGELLSMQELAARERLYLGRSRPLLYLWTESGDGALAPSLALQDVQPSGVRRPRPRAAEEAAQPLAIDATFVGGVTRLMCGRRLCTRAAGRCLREPGCMRSTAALWA